MSRDPLLETHHSPFLGCCSHFHGRRWRHLHSRQQDGVKDEKGCAPAIFWGRCPETAIWYWLVLSVMATLSCKRDWCCLYSEWPCSQLQMLFLWKKDRTEIDRQLPVGHTTSLHLHLPFLSLALILRALTHSVFYFHKLYVQSVDHLGESLTTFSCPGAASLPSVSVTKFPVSMSFFETWCIFPTQIWEISCSA